MEIKILENNNLLDPFEGYVSSASPLSLSLSLSLSPIMQDG